MNSLVKLIASAAIATAFGASGAHAQSPGSFSAAISNVEIVPLVVCDAGILDPLAALNCHNTASNFLTLNIKTSSGSGTSLLVGGSLETAIFTETVVTGGGGTQKATAEGSIIVTMTVDGNEAPVGCTTNCPNGVAYPPVVTYDQRQQTLTANLGVVCTITNLILTCTGESVGLILSTMSAHEFNFVVPNLSEGVHTVTFSIAVAANASVSNTLLAGSIAKAGVGVGSLTAQVVKVQTPFDAITLGSGGTTTFTF